MHNHPWTLAVCLAVCLLAVFPARAHRLRPTPWRPPTS